jgi:hypothetical protein
LAVRDEGVIYRLSTLHLSIVNRSALLVESLLRKTGTCGARVA